MLNQREQMVEQQVRAWEVLDPAVLDIMQSIPREHFLPEKLKKLAHADSAFQLRPDFKMPCPSVQGKILQALELHGNDTIHQIGAGSGYLSACLAALGGHVCISDVDADLLEHIQQQLHELGYKNIETNLTTWDQAINSIEKKYDVVVSQFEFTNTPSNLEKTLKHNGRALLFTGSSPNMSCILSERIGENEWVSDSLFETVVSNYPQKAKTRFAF